MNVNLFDIVFHIIRDWRGYHRRSMVEALATNCEGVAKLLVVEPAAYPRAYGLKRLTGSASNVRLPRMEQISENLYVLRPRKLVPYISPLSKLIPLSRTYRAKQIRDTLRTLNFTAPRFAYINHPVWVPFMAVAQEDYIVFECRDQYSWRVEDGAPNPYMEKLELQLLKEADVVFAATKLLHAKMSALHSNAHFLSNGVDFELFSHALSDKTAVPEDLARIPRPRVGYIGGVWPAFDFDLLEYLSRQRPQWSFAVIGSPSHVPEKIKVLQNIHFLGWKLHEELPNYLKGIDVTIVPLIRNRYTEQVSPLTIWEHMAAGRLVVSTDVVQGRRLSDVVFIANNREQFLAHTEEALSGDHTLRIQQGIALARDHSWLKITRKVPDILSELVTANR